MGCTVAGSALARRVSVMAEPLSAAISLSSHPPDPSKSRRMKAGPDNVCTKIKRQSSPVDFAATRRLMLELWVLSPTQRIHTSGILSGCSRSRPSSRRWLFFQHLSISVRWSAAFFNDFPGMLPFPQSWGWGLKAGATPGADQCHLQVQMVAN